MMARLNYAGLAIAIAFLILAPLEFHRYGLYILSQWAVMTIAAIGLNLTLGYAGQVSLARYYVISRALHAIIALTVNIPGIRVVPFAFSTIFMALMGLRLYSTL